MFTQLTTHTNYDLDYLKNQASKNRSIDSDFNLVDLLRKRAINQPKKIAYTFLENGESESIKLTYQDLDLEARNLAAKLQSLKLTGERALLLYPPGIEFISAFFGCLYAGVIPVPLYPPKRNQNLSRLQSVMANAQALLALTTEPVLKTIEKHFDSTPDLAALTWLTTDTPQKNCSHPWSFPKLDADSIAFLQYTSGSTGNPKGVMVTHGNLLHNEQMIEQAFSHTHKSSVVGWLPLFHDMGLIGNILQPLYLGIPCTLMSPVDFLQKPYRWLKAISDYGATTSGGPNFAYDLCVKKITPEQLETLNLSGWELAFTGAEPIREQTMEQFAQKFAPCGFRKTAFYPCYGMAEATLFITGGLASQVPVVKTVDDKALTEDRVVEVSREQTHAVTLVGCGGACLGQTVKIVNPQTLTECDNNQVGEIWVSGDSVAKGYWREPQKTKDTFAAYLTDTGEGPFLRTGDLGFFSEDLELFVTGRLKDVIIIRGRNHYPQDIESTVEQCHGAVVNHRSAAFTVQVNGTDQLMVTAELERRYHQRRQHTASVSPGQERRKGERRQESEDPGFEVAPPPSHPPIFDEIVSSIKQAVCRHHGLQVYRVLLLRVGTIPKTSSGKIQRYACREGLLNDSLNVVFDSKP
ncbi:fatty acyl-AMP ligase [Crocosphaera sp.]|uniref:fatty acyl-AMP ligase n=1 Tax=Crocosphaera sp. TaxID=2729996 RepID=UPI003F28D973|nr:fatty acyl-AMP ligase [Crocosphaera sp.]